MDCLKARDIYSWLEQIPQAYVTLIFDCRQNFVASFGKQRDPEVVEIMEDPWSVLTSLNSSTVVYYLRPDITAMAKLQDRDDKVKDAVGMLTDGINSAFPQFCLRKGVGGGVELAGACHMMFYETLSFYWHRRGRQHKAFVPAVAVSAREGGEGRGGVGGWVSGWVGYVWKEDALADSSLFLSTLCRERESSCP